MSISIYDASVVTVRRMLVNLGNILDKAAAHIESRKLDPNALLQARLFPDMFTLTRQVQIACDFAKGAGARLAGVEVPKHEDNETSFSELQARIAKTIDFLDAITPAQLEGSETREVLFPLRGKVLKVNGADFLLKLVLPNLYFHITTAYGILRHNGVELGKPDFIGPL